MWLTQSGSIKAIKDLNGRIIKLCLTNKGDLTDMIDKYSKLRVSGLKFGERLREVHHENSA